jgi:hypothetical protein
LILPAQICDARMPPIDSGAHERKIDIARTRS